MSNALLTRSEAAQLSGASPVAVKKAIDQGVIPTRSRRRQSFVEAEDVGLLALLPMIGGAQLPLTQKRRLRAWLRSAAPGAELELSPALVVRRVPQVADALARAERYARLREKWIVTDEERRGGGEPIIKGSRVSVYTIAGRIAAGDSDEVLEEDYPHIPPEAREVAAIYGAANPRRGRPRRAARRG